MLTHHDARDYQVAASDAAKFARTKMEAAIAGGGPKGLAVIEKVHAQMPQDAIVAGRALAFEATSDALAVRLGNGAGMERGIHRHALAQMSAKAGIPSAYVAELAAEAGWKRDLAAHTLNTHYHAGESNTRHLVRSVKGEVRGFLSDRYRRLDSRPLLDTFAAECQRVGAVPVEGSASDLRWSLKAFLPMVFEPVPNEVLCVGVEIGNSDFGSAKFTLRMFIWRLWCTNLATMEDSLATVHLGKVLSDDIEFSNKTYALDTRTSVSATKDVVAGLLGPAKVNGLLETIKRADEKKIEWKTLRAQLAKKLLKEEMKAVEDAWKTEDVTMLPSGESAWRASNAVSWVAGKADDADRRLELQRIAGEIVNGKADKAEAA